MPVLNATGVQTIKFRTPIIRAITDNADPVRPIVSIVGDLKPVSKWVFDSFPDSYEVM